MVSDAGLEAHAKGAAVAVRHVSIRQHASAYVSIRQHTSAYVSIRQQAHAEGAVVAVRQRYVVLFRAA